MTHLQEERAVVQLVQRQLVRATEAEAEAEAEAAEAAREQVRLNT